MRSQEEEIVNAYTHLLSSILALVLGTVVLTGDFLEPKSKVIFSIMFLTACWTFFASFLYHKTFHEPQRQRNRLVDRVAIYMMIMGSGVATSMTCLDPKISLWSSIALVIITCGFIVNMCIKRSLPEWFCVTSYILLGWIGIFPALGIFGSSGFVEANVLSLLLTSGACYSIGVVFYSNDYKKWYHTIWHIFTIFGFIFHFIAEIKALAVIQ